MTDPLNREMVVFNAALELPAAKRAAYLDQACAGDGELLRRLKALLQANEAAGNFLAKPVLETPSADTAESVADDEMIPDPSAGPLSEKPGDRIGRYKLLQKIGEGGCGVVYMAEQETPVRRRVALKIIKLGMATRNVIARFEAERQALALMDHPNIAKVLDAGATEAGRPYFVMELVRGIKINEYCDQNNLSTQARLEVFLLVCQAVQHAHQKGIIHRDLKPSNILVADHDGVPVPKVIDFGIAKATSDQRLTDKTLFTAFEQFIGTPAYMSPEQANLSGIDIDTRTDIYSLGVLLYELLTGKTPFDSQELLAAGLDEMRRTIREKDPARPSTRLNTMGAADLTTVAKHRQAEGAKLTSLISGDLDWIVMKALEKDRTRRYETANGLAADIRRHLNSEPVVACPPSNLYRLQKMVRRNKLTFVAAGAVAASLVLGLAFSSWQAIRATKSERSERDARIAAEQARTRESEERARVTASEQRARSLLYAADMRLVQQAWDEGNLSRMTSLLEAHRPKSGEADERGFEYFYFQNLAKGEQEQVLYHATNVVMCVAISPDGKWLASRSTTEVRLWDLASRSLVFTIPNSATNGDSFALDPFECNASFSFDSQYLSVATETGLQLFQIPTRQIRHLTTEPVGWVGFSPNTNLVLFNEGKIYGHGKPLVWDYVAKKEVGTPGTEPAFCWSPDGTRLLAGRWDTDVLAWDTATWSQPLTNSFDSYLTAAVVSRVGGLLAIADWQGMVHLIESMGGKEIGTISSGDARASALAVSPDGKRLATGSGTEVIQLWDLTTRQRVRQFRGHQGKVTSLAFTPDGRLLASSATDGEVRLWNLTRPTAEFQMTNEIMQFGENPPQFSPDGKWLAMGTNGGDVKLSGLVLEASNLQAIATFTGEPGRFSPDARQLATLSSGNSHDLQLRVLTTSGFSNRACIHLDEPTYMCPLTLSPNGCFAAIGVVRSPKPGEAGYGLQSGLFNASTGEKIFEAQSSAGWIPSSCFLPDGRTWVYAVGAKIMLLDLQTRTNRLTLQSDSTVFFMAVLPDGKMLAASHANDLISLWDLNSGKQLGTLTGHGAHVLSLAFSQDGRTLASGSEDRTIKLWHLATQRELASFTQDMTVYWLTFSPDNQMLVSGELGSYQFRRAPRDETAVMPSLPKLSMADLPTNSIWLVPDGADQMPPRMVAEQDQCFTNMLKIYSAIMAYRKDHQQMPDWLSDLVPKYLSDTNCLICPVCARTERKPDLNGMDDPKLTSSYFYEFNAHTNMWPDAYGVASPGDTMKQWKEKELLHYGPVVPVVRCAMHPHFLSVTFDGKRRLDPDGNWEKVEELKLKQRAATNAVPATR